LAILVILLLKSNFLPGNVMALVPLIVALAIGTGFEKTLGVMHEGISDVLVIAALFIFASIYFGVMSDAGLFEPIINRLMKSKFIGKSVFSVVAVTAVIAMITHLDGQGLTTLMVTVPPMLIIFDKLKISRTLMSLIFCTVVGCMNLLPWAGPVPRVAVVLNMDVMDIYMKLLPVHIIGLVLSFVVLYIASKAEQKRGEFIPATDAGLGQIELSDAEKALRRPKLFWANLVITILLLASLFLGLPSYIAFLVACAIVLPLNYRTTKEQNALIKRYAGNTLVNIYTIIGAGALLGIMEGTGMFDALGNAIVSLIPESLGGGIHIILGVLVTPLSFLLNTDSMMYGIMPVAINVAAGYGIPAITTAAIFSAGRVIGTGLCLTTPSVYLGLGLMGITYKEGFKANAKWLLLLGTVLVLITAVIVR
jgi:CitMHS family citrate-Mg2+:H+ or citrate-Ca2+:H+ symporter